MSDHEYVETAMWSDPTILALTPHAKLLYTWSFTNPRCNLLGIYKVGREQIRVELGLTRRALQEAVDVCGAAHLMFYDDEYLFVRARVKKLQGKSPNTAKGIHRQLKKLDQRHPYVQAFLFLYQGYEWAQLQAVLQEFDCPPVSPLIGVMA